MLKKIIFIFFCFISYKAIAQTVFTLPGNVEVVGTPMGTGQATGEVVKLILINKSKETIYFDSPPIYIPSDGKHQAYLIPRSNSVLLAPEKKTEVILKGYCLDLKRPAVPRKNKMPSIVEWRFLDELEMSNIQKYIVEPKYLTISNVIANLPININDKSKTALIPRERLEEGLPMILDAFIKLETTIKSIQSDTQLVTVFSNTPSKEKETLLQHSLWLYVSALTGNSYEYEFFEEKLIAEAERALSKSFEKQDNQTKDELLEGGKNLWESFRNISQVSSTIKSVKD